MEIQNVNCTDTQCKSIQKSKCNHSRRSPEILRKQRITGRRRAAHLSISLFLYSFLSTYGNKNFKYVQPSSISLTRSAQAVAGDFTQNRELLRLASVTPPFQCDLGSIASCQPLSTLSGATPRNAWHIKNPPKRFGALKEDGGTQLIVIIFPVHKSERESI
jgi:hypothetical protein